MSNLNYFHTAFRLCFALALSTIAVPTAFAQLNPDIDASIKIDVDEILGVSAEDVAPLPLLVDKSIVSKLDFLSSGDSLTSIDQLKEMQGHVASLYQQVEPAVVSIRSGMGQGSGVVVSSDGYILTAAHVIAVPNRSAVITFPDGTRALAQTLGMFRTLDAGLLKIYAMMPARKEKEDEDSEDEDAEEEDSEEEDSEEEDSEEEDSEEEDSEESDGDDGDSESDDSEGESGEEMSDEGGESDDESDEPDEEDSDEIDDSKEQQPKKPKQRTRFAVQDDLPSFDYLDIGDSTKLNLGQWAIAVGHPGGLDEDRGIVLRVGRIVKIDADSEAANFQTDCTLVGGDSGGPLIGIDGSVLGIHSRIGMGLRDNYHVPANDFLNNWSDLLEPVVHDRKAMTFIRFKGQTTVIDRIPKNTISARSGLKAKDRIVRIGEKDVYDKLQFDDAISKLKPYQRVEFEVQRKGKKKVIYVTIGEEPKSNRR